MHTTFVVQNNPLTQDTHSVLLEKPEGFTYEPGQFIVVQTTIDGKPVRRSYSLASAPHQDYLEIIVKAQPQGLVSPHLCALAPGTEIHVLGPFGHFTLQDDNAVLISAGTGIAPFMSYLRHVAHTNSKHTITLLAAYRHETDILLHEELSQLTTVIALDYHITLTRPDTAWQGLRGRVDKNMIETLPEAAYYLCGPTPMVSAVQQALTARGITHIRTEKYGSITA